MNPRKLMTDHPNSVGQSYLGHMAFALALAGLMLRAGLAALVHALLPFLFETTASDLLQRVNRRIGERHGAAPGEGRNVSLGRL